MKPRSSLLVSLAIVVGFAGSNAARAAAPVEVENLETISATVQAIDVAKRLVTLRGPEGNVATIEVGPEVRNLAQVKVGDKLVVKYYESLAGEIKAKGTSATLGEIDRSAVASSAAPGDKPAAAVGSRHTTTVTIQGVDKKNNSVMFSGPDGLVRNVTAKRPEGQKFVGTLKKGDEVELTYTEALAVSIEAAK